MMQDRGPQVLTVAIIFISMTWTAVGLRCYVRGRMLQTFGLDDWLMLATQILFTAYIICQIGGVVYGTGRHIWDLTVEENETALHFWWFCELWYISAASMLKVALGVFLLRLAVNKIHIWILRSLIAGTGVFGTSYFFIALFQCHPVSAWWIHGPSSPQCISPMVMTGATYCASVINSLADWTFGILPAFIVWNLEMARRQKIMVAGILAFAAIGSAATIVRIPSIEGLEHTKDFLWDTSSIAMWSTVEPGIGITAGCLVTLRPLVHAIFHSDVWRSHISNRFSNRYNGSKPTPRNTGPISAGKSSIFTTISSNFSRSHRAKSPLPFHSVTSQRGDDAYATDNSGNRTTITITTRLPRNSNDDSSDKLWLASPAEQVYSMKGGSSKIKDAVVTASELTELQDLGAMGNSDIEKATPLGATYSPTSSVDGSKSLGNRSIDVMGKGWHRLE